VPSASIQSWGVLLDISSGKVIAVDQDGHPALVINTIGAGKTLLSAYPVEHYLAAVPGVFDKAENTHAIYEAFRDWTGFKPAFRSNHPEVELSVLAGEHRSYLVLVNHSDQPQDETVSRSVPGGSYSLITPEGTKPLTTDGPNAKLHLGSYEGAILEWKQ
jgi:endo-1,4-beta-mannosidase